MYFLKLIRFKNLILLATMQLVFHFGFLKNQTINLALSDWQFLLLVLATLCIAAGGYLINAVFDKTTDQINTPEKVIIGKHISESSAYNYYTALNVIGVGIGFYLSNFIGKPSFSGIFIVIAATLYLYASSLKKSLIIGNIIIAAILAISVLIIGIYDLQAVITPENQPFMGVLFGILIDYAIFAFLINLTREIIKDFENKNKDIESGSKTIPVVFGEKTGKIILTALLVATIALLGWYSIVYMFDKDLYLITIYVFGLILAPLIYVLIRLWNAADKKDYSHLSLILKLVVLFGILSVLVLVYTIKMVNSVV